MIALLLVFASIAAYALMAVPVCIALERIGLGTEDAQSIAVLWPVAVLLAVLLWPLGIVAWMLAAPKGAR